ncbi:MAG: hypothetical protein V7K72_06785 [Nostoc sp.]|uniref:hypothetical protein n=1 Tax=Nostoc sp. TaxID=1180 RepID=UPI002FF498BD
MELYSRTADPVIMDLILSSFLNRDPAEYSNTDDKRNASMLLILLNSLSGRDVRNEMLRYIKGQ